MSVKPYSLWSRRWRRCYQLLKLDGLHTLCDVIVALRQRYKDQQSPH